MKDVVLSMDLGGTNARFGAVLRNGEIVTRHRIKTPKTDSVDEFMDAVAGGYHAVARMAAAEINKVAAAIPATVGERTKFLSKLPNLPVLEGVDFTSELARRVDATVTLENDATAATTGEHWLGASMGVETVVGVTLGTGIGGGIFVNGSLFRGKDGSAGEIGHICVEPLGHQCGCGSNGCVERYASGTAILQMAISEGLNVTAAIDVYNMALAGDRSAIRIFDEAGKYLGIVLAGIINFLNPDMIVIGGGVSASWELLIGPIQSEIRKRAYPEPAKRAKVVRAKLGDDAGILGAAKAAFDQAMPY